MAQKPMLGRLVLRLAASDPDDWERLHNGDQDELPHIVSRFGCAGGSQALELWLHADNGAIRNGTGQPFDNHPSSFPGFASGAGGRDEMPL